MRDNGGDNNAFHLEDIEKRLQYLRRKREEKTNELSILAEGVPEDNISTAKRETASLASDLWTLAQPYIASSSTATVTITDGEGEEGLVGKGSSWQSAISALSAEEDLSNELAEAVGLLDIITSCLTEMQAMNAAYDPTMKSENVGLHLLVSKYAQAESLLAGLSNHLEQEGSSPASIVLKTLSGELKSQCRHLRERAVRGIHSILQIHSGSITVHRRRRKDGMASPPSDEYTTDFATLCRCVERLGNAGTHHQMDRVLQQIGYEVVRHVIEPVICGVGGTSLHIENHLVQEGEMTRLLLVESSKGSFKADSLSSTLEAIRMVGSFFSYTVLHEMDELTALDMHSSLLKPVIEAFRSKVKEQVDIDPLAEQKINTFLSEVDSAVGGQVFAQLCTSSGEKVLSTIIQHKSALASSRMYVLGAEPSKDGIEWDNLLKEADGFCRGLVAREVAAIFPLLAPHNSQEANDGIDQAATASLDTGDKFAQSLFSYGHRQCRQQIGGLETTWDVQKRLSSMVDVIVALRVS